MVFGDILRELLEENNMTQKQLGDALNIAPSTVGNYIRNIREPDYATLLEFARYFGVPTDYLLGYSTDKRSSHGEQKLINIYRKLNCEYREILTRQASLLNDMQNKKAKE